MLHTLATWLLIAAFFGAGLFNTIGTQATQASFVHWGFPRWWCYVTGTVEMAVAVLIALPGTLEVGLIVGLLVIIAAALTVLRHRDFSHIAPLSLFVVLLVLAGVAR